MTPIAARIASGSRVRSCPATSIRPASGGIKVDRIWTVVVLPAPFGPRREKTVPSGTARSMPSSTSVSPNDFRRPVTLIAWLGVRAVALEARGDGRSSGVRRIVMSPMLVRACTSTAWSAGPGSPVASISVRTLPNCVCTSSLAAVPAWMPISMAPRLVFRLAAPRVSPPTRRSPLAVVASTPARACSTSMRPLAPLTRRSPSISPSQTSPLELLITALPCTWPSRICPDPVETSAVPVT